MDNVEVYEGLASADWLERNVLGDTTKANYYLGKKNLNATGIEILWNTTNNNYNSSYGQASNWGVFYADAACQVYPIWTGVIAPTSPRAISLYDTLNTNYPGWPSLSTPDAFPWAILAYSGSVMGDSTRVNTFLENIQNTYISTGRSWPYYNMEAGFTIRAAKQIRDKDNLALSKTVSASANSGTAPNANNGILYDNWTSGTADNQWIQVDLGISKTMNRLVVKWDGTYATQYKIQVSDNGTTFTDAYTEAAGNGGTDDIAFTEVTKRYVKLLFTAKSSSNGVSIREFELYNAASEIPINLALNKTATASSFPADTQKSVDGSLSTRWGSAYLDNEWYKVDLGDLKSIDKVIINWEVAYDSAYSVQTSTDDSTYTTVYSTSTGDGGIDTITFAPTTARYVKVLLTTRATIWGSSFWELEVFNISGTQIPLNLAKNKVTTASSNTSFTGLSVDDNLTTRWGSSYADNEWYTVDLGMLYSVSKAVINWEEAYDSVYSIQVSTDNINFTTVYSTSSGNGGIDTLTFGSQIARYVRILLTTRATIYGSSFWEFEVYQ